MVQNAMRLRGHGLTDPTTCECGKECPTPAAFEEHCLDALRRRSQPMDAQFTLDHVR